MYQIIAITPLTMKRLLNYQRVTEKKAQVANQHQWKNMTLETMREAEKTRQWAALVGSSVTYAGYLFRVQNNTATYRERYCDGLVYNALVELMNTLGIAVEMVAIDGAIQKKADRVAAALPACAPQRSPLHLVTSNDSRGCR